MLEVAGHHGAQTVDTASLVTRHQGEGREESQLDTIRLAGVLGHCYGR